MKINMNCYIHIPFCDHICYYCDFCRMVSNQKDEYIHALEREVQSLSFSKIDTLYFGGGTPSSLSIEQIKKIANLFKKYLSNEYEWTMECNPDSLSIEKIRCLKELGINRISLGVQSFNDEILSSIGRHHTSQDVYACIESLREVGIDNISIDLIYGLPDQSIEDVENDIQQFLSLKLPHLSIYSLQVEPNSVFGKKGVLPCDEELEADMYERICSILKQNGYQHYEISSFCKNGAYSKHNLCYWDDSDFIGIGCGASGREEGWRYDHTRDIKEYILNPMHREYIESEQEDREFETIMMSLRTVFGMDIVRFNEKYNANFMEEYKDALSKNQQFLEIKNNRLMVNENGMELLNSILIDFLK